MRVLLDTHAMYWYIEGDPQLSGTARTLIQDASNVVLISPASYWEIAIKVSIGKWKLNRTYDEFIDIALNKYGFQILPILPTHAAKVIGLPFHSQRPVRPSAGAQGLTEAISIVSADSALDAYGVTRLW